MNDESSSEIIELERAALERWAKGDPSGFLEFSDPSVTYFDPCIERRLDGLAELTRLYEGFRGQGQIDSFELVNPKVQFAGEAAVLTFNFVSRSGERQDRWNCTEVYHRTSERGWKIIHTHWSLTAAVKL